MQAQSNVHMCVSVQAHASPSSLESETSEGKRVPQGIWTRGMAPGAPAGGGTASVGSLPRHYTPARQCRARGTGSVPSVSGVRGGGLLEIRWASLHEAAGVSGGSSAASRRQGWPASGIAGVFLRALRGSGTDALLSLVGGHVGSGERERQDRGRERTVTGPTSPALGGEGCGGHRAPDGRATRA